jgi:hypothetical protein
MDRLYARETSQDPNGLFVIDKTNNPTKTPTGYGWKPASGAGANVSISSNFYGTKPDNRQGGK